MIEQAAIATLGVAACWLSQSPKERERAQAPWFGLASQPFWLYATIQADQWGMAALSLIYTVGWIRGIRTYRRTQ
jgi:hypothetical protein